jgi:choline-sulfatase
LAVKVGVNLMGGHLATYMPGSGRLGLAIAVAWLAGFAGRSAAQDSRTNFNLILIALTNTRADHLGCYGYARNTSPNLDKLARNSVVFKNAFTHASWTLPASVSLFTSTYPFTHGLMNRERATPLPASAVTFIDVLKTNGYVTAAFVGNRDYSAKFGHTARFDAMFDAGAKNVDQEDWHSYGVLANTVPPAREWLRKNRDRKFLLLLQGYDTHCPFAIPTRNAQFDPGYTGEIDFTKCYWTFEKTRPLKVRSKSGRYDEVYLLKTKANKGDNYEVQFFPDDVRHMVALYDGEIFNADALLGQVLDDVKALGLEQRTVIVFYSDHGDMFGKHGRFMRGGPLRGTFYDDVLRIPLIIHQPGLPSRTVDELAQFIDVAPTLLDLLGLPSPGSFRGKSLRGAMLGERGPNKHVFAGSAFSPSESNPFFRHESVLYAVRTERWKLICERLQFSVGTQDQFELYDLKSDPQEISNAAEKNPEMVAELKGTLLQWLDETKAREFRPAW